MLAASVSRNASFQFAIGKKSRVAGDWRIAGAKDDAARKRAGIVVQEVAGAKLAT